MKVNIHQAKTNLSSLILKAEGGEVVIIARAGKPVVRLVAVAHCLLQQLFNRAPEPRGRVWSSNLGRLKFELRSFIHAPVRS